MKTWTLAYGTVSAPSLPLSNLQNHSTNPSNVFVFQFFSPQHRMASNRCTFSFLCPWFTPRSLHSMNLPPQRLKSNLLSLSNFNNLLECQWVSRPSWPSISLLCFYYMTQQVWIVESITSSGLISIELSLPTSFDLKKWINTIASLLQIHM